MEFMLNQGRQTKYFKQLIRCLQRYMGLRKRSAGCCQGISQGPLTKPMLYALHNSASVHSFRDQLMYTCTNRMSQEIQVIPPLSTHILECTLIISSRRRKYIVSVHIIIFCALNVYWIKSISFQLVCLLDFYAILSFLGVQENRGTSRILIPRLFYLPDCAIPLGRARGRMWEYRSGCHCSLGFQWG